MAFCREAIAARALQTERGARWLKVTHHNLNFDMSREGLGSRLEERK